MHRRALLQACVSLSGLATLLSHGPRHGVLSCYVAGARFHRPLPDLCPGDLLQLQRTLVGGAPAIAVMSRGRPLGYVPRAHLARVSHLATSARLRAVHLDAVPWRWYRIEMI